MKRIAMMVVLGFGLGFAVGCDDSQDPAAKAGVEAAQGTEQASASPEVVSPLELLPDEPKVAQTPTSNAVHPIAGRSAFPEHDEVIARPIPAKQLSDESQFLEPVDEDNIPDVVPWTEAKKYIGYEITVEGKIVDLGQSRDGKVNFLNFHQEWRGKFYMVVFDDLAKTLDQGVEQTFLNKTLRVTGTVEDHRGRPQIKILSLDQVQFVGG